MQEGWAGERESLCTIKQQAICKDVNGPKICGPVGVAEAAFEGKQSREDLLDLPIVNERPKGGQKHQEDRAAKQEKSRWPERVHGESFPFKAIVSEEIQEIGRGQVSKDVLEVEQNGKENAPA